ncbi:MAG TPA: hypothetical protein VMU05_24910 [Dongiaceae bacterium]|nr:hypothetical protein [Dongiaceae bacterium]
MRSFKYVVILLCLLSAAAVASENKLGVREVHKVTFATSVRIGTNVLPAGEYVVRHSMEGQDHFMLFERIHSKDVVKVKCTLVPLPKKAGDDVTVFQTAGNEKVLQELIFSGETAKHVF